MKSIFHTLPQMLQAETNAEHLDEAFIFAAWRRVIGENLRERAVPFRVFNKNLIVAVSDETWKKHLESLAGQMLFKLNAALEKATIEFIEFRVDSETVNAERDKHFKTEKSALENQRIALAHIPPNVAKAAENISDENLRRNFLLAAGSCMARKKSQR
ncbi:MAG: DUF721 domain-containing protein [Pyrinomonadaceae bacterium]|nr:DUF721 domain-containing protein [Pyrinomonadaceae bacterium]